MLPFAGVLIGFIGSVCGIGGGLFTVPLLHFVVGLSLARSVATGLVLVVATTGAATLTELLQGAPNLQPLLFAGLVPGVLLGAQLGFRVSQRINPNTLRRVFIVVLLFVGVRVLFGNSDTLANPEALPTARVLGVGFLVGLGGGFLAPLLGVGGGLIMVPGLFLGLPGLGFAAARTASLAAGAVGASRSLWLHARAGRVSWRAGLGLGLGALVGAAVGVIVTRDPAWVVTGRIGLGVLVLYVASRFAVELLRRPQAE